MGNFNDVICDGFSLPTSTVDATGTACVCWLGPPHPDPGLPRPEPVQLCSSFLSFLISHQSFHHYNTVLLWASHSVQDYSLSSIEACSTDVFLVKRHPGLPADIHTASWPYQQPACMTSLGSLLLDEVSWGPGPKMPISSVYGAFLWHGDSDRPSLWSVACILYRQPCADYKINSKLKRPQRSSICSPLTGGEVGSER